MREKQQANGRLRFKKPTAGSTAVINAGLESESLFFLIHISASIHWKTSVSDRFFVRFSRMIKNRACNISAFLSTIRFLIKDVSTS